MFGVAAVALVVALVQAASGGDHANATPTSAAPATAMRQQPGRRVSASGRSAPLPLGSRGRTRSGTGSRAKPEAAAPPPSSRAGTEA